MKVKEEEAVTEGNKSANSWKTRILVMGNVNVNNRCLLKVSIPSLKMPEDSCSAIELSNDRLEKPLLLLPSDLRKFKDEDNGIIISFIETASFIELVANRKLLHFLCRENDCRAQKSRGLHQLLVY